MIHTESINTQLMVNDHTDRIITHSYYGFDTQSGFVHTELYTRIHTEFNDTIHTELIIDAKVKCMLNVLSFIY